MKGSFLWQCGAGFEKDLNGKSLSREEKGSNPKLGRRWSFGKSKKVNQAKIHEQQTNYNNQTIELEKNAALALQMNEHSNEIQRKSSEMHELQRKERLNGIQKVNSEIQKLIIDEPLNEIQIKSTEIHEIQVNEHLNQIQSIGIQVEPPNAKVVKQLQEHLSIADEVAIQVPEQNEDPKIDEKNSQPIRKFDDERMANMIQLQQKKLDDIEIFQHKNLISDDHFGFVDVSLDDDEEEKMIEKVNNKPAKLITSRKKIHDLPLAIVAFFDRMEVEQNPETTRKCLALVTFARAGFKPNELEDILSLDSGACSTGVSRLLFVLQSYLSPFNSWLHPQFQATAEEYYGDIKSDIYKLLSKWTESTCTYNAYASRMFYLSKQGRTQDMATLLLDFRWLQYALCAGVHPRIIVNDASALREDEFPQAMQVLHVLEQSQKSLCHDPKELASQLMGKLNSTHPILPCEPSCVKSWLVSLPRVKNGHSSCISSVSISQDGSRIVSGGYDCKVIVWDTETGGMVHEFRQHSKSVSSVRLNSRIVVSGSADSNVNVYDVVSGRCLHVLRGHSKGVKCLSISSDGNTIVSGSADRTIKVWAVATGKCVQTLQGHLNMVFSVDLNYDGSLVVSGSADRTVKLWSSKGGNCLQIMHGHASSVNYVEMNGNIVMSESRNNRLTWEVVTGDLPILSQELAPAKIDKKVFVSIPGVDVGFTLDSPSEGISCMQKKIYGVAAGAELYILKVVQTTSYM